ncbi:hypothetical protein E2C01_044319 [Portunus trituberculatus]|uniref:Uncharacterized protein n=1 Tax=Portunus trituberculatus TaxID=210409 RepID=A0A5B7FRT5_PORTR|nr:hypothetical protein [Portunus trituberculatus]
MEGSDADKANMSGPSSVVKNSGPHTDDPLPTAHCTLFTCQSILGSPSTPTAATRPLGKSRSQELLSTGQPTLAATVPSFLVEVDCTLLLAATALHSGAWFLVIPVESLSLLLPDNAVRVNVTLRLSLRVQQPHRCRYGALNDVVYRTLAPARVVATLEPRGLYREDESHPNDITVFPYRQGKMLMWDANCLNTCSTPINHCAGAAARAAEYRKRRRYDNFVRRYDFSPHAVETSGVLGPTFNDLLQDIGSRISQHNGEPCETPWLQPCRAAICGHYPSL